MEIISHRGLWRSEGEKNTIAAFNASFKNGFGTETDIRDFNGELVISHDIATSQSIKAEQFFEIYKSYDIESTLALNIKADGLQNPLYELLKKYDVQNYFTFDMSIPDTLGYNRIAMPFFSRQSEHEMNPSFYESCNGIWLDCFNSIWYSAEVIKTHLQNGKSIALVSPELHKRDSSVLWEFLKSNELHVFNNLILCTDLPIQANTFFYNANQ